MANEFVTRTGLIVSGSTFLPAVTTASKGYILSFDDTTKQVYYMSTSSVTVTVPGSDTQIIYNNGGAFGAASNFVFSGSNVGIGTTSPSAKLTVKGSGTTSSTTALLVQNANASSSLIVKDDGQIQVSSTSVANPGYSFIDNTDTGLYMVGGTMGTVVDGQYSILYGADGPQLYSNTTNSITSANLLMAKIGSNHRMSIWMNGNNDFQFEAWQSGVGYSNNIILQEFGGNVGIGTTSPAEKLDVSGSIKILYPTGKLYAAATPSFYGEITPFNASGQMIFNVNYPEGNIIFQSGSVEVARFKDSKLGIGTSTPGAKLEVDGNSYTTGLRISDTTSHSTNLFQNGTVFNINSQFVGDSISIQPADYLSISTYSGSVVERVRVTNGGNVGIGTTNPQNNLHISGAASSDASNIRIDSTTQYGGLVIYENTTLRTILGYGNAGNIFSNAQTDSTALRAANYLHLGASSVATITINGSDNVGIGTTSPNAKLDVNGNVLVTGSLTVSGSSTFTNIGPAVFTGSITQNASTASFGGLVGIGTTTPDQKLDVNGTGIFRDVLYTVGNIYGFTPSYGNSFLINNNAGSTYFNATGGNVGIGTTGPGAKLTIYSDTTSDGILVDVLSKPRITLRDRGNSDTILGTGDYGLDDFFIDTYSGNAFAIKGSTRNVGIGTTSPANKLDVNSGTAASAFRVVSTNTTSSRIFFEATSGNVEQHFLYTGNQDWVLGLDKADSNKFKLASADDGFASAKLTVTTGGNVGIGITSPTQKLQVNGGIALNTTTDGSSRYYTYPDVNHSWYYDDNILGSSADVMTYYENFLIRYQDTTNVFSINGNGNVGIGTVSPTAKLEVNGNVKATSFTGSFSGSVSAPGSTTQIVYNSGGSLAADSGLVYSGSNVGIGTSSPLSLLSLSKSGLVDLQFNASDQATDEKLWVWQGGSPVGTGVYRLRAVNDAYSNGINALIFTRTGISSVTSAFTGGDVGIGTASPSRKLHVTSGAGIAQFQSTTTSGTVYFGDTNSSVIDNQGIGSRGNDIAIAAGGFDRLTVASGGKVGIGTSNPSQSLSVNGAIESLGDGFGEGGQLILRGTTYRYNVDNYNGQALRFFREDDATLNSGTVLMYISASSNIGIGTTAPGAKLDIVSTGAGSEGLRVDGSGGGFAFVVKAGSDYTSHIRAGATVGVNYFTTPPSNGLVVEGNVGIGTTSPISGQGTPLTLASSTGYVGLTLSGSGAYSHLWQLYASGDGGSNKFFGIYDSTNAVYRLVTTSTGNVGIGTTNPTYNLHVSSSGYYGGNLTVEGTITAQKLNVQQITSSVIYSSGSNVFGNSLSNTQTFTGSLQVTGSTHYLLGNVGIGTTSPSEKLELSGTGNVYARVTTTDASNAGVRFNAVGAREYGIFSDGSLRFYDFTDATERMRITSTGKIGIGTTTPTSLLYVYNDIAWSAANLNEVTGSAMAFKVRSRNSINSEIVMGAMGDDDTGLQAINNSTAAALKFVINPFGGNVGIGTTSPGAKLDVNGDIYLSETGRLQGRAYPYDTTVGSGADASTAIIEAGSTSGYRSRIALAGGNATDPNTIKFLTTSAERMRIDSTGNLMLGVTSVYGGGAQDAKFTMVGGAPAADAARGNMILMDTKAYNASPLFSIMLGGQFNSSNSTTFFGGIAGGKENATDNDYAGFLSLYTRANGGGRSEAVRITSAGNVGIGTTSPNIYSISGATTTLSIQATGTNQGSLLDISATGTGFSGINIGNSTIRRSFLGTLDGSNFVIYTNATNSGTSVTERMRITAAGNVGIGTDSPASKLDLYNGTDLGLGANGIRVQRPGAYGQYGYLEYLPSSDVTVLGSLYTGGGSSAFGQIYFRQHSSTTSRDIMVINSSGNVGIGTNSPLTKLTVNGDTNISAASTGNSYKLYFGDEVTSGPGKGMFLETYYLKLQGHRNEGIILQGVNATGSVQQFAAFYGDNNAKTSQIHLAPSGGNVGIGTTSPEFPLDVNGNIKLGTTLLFSGTNYYPRIARSTNDLHFSTDNAGSADVRLAITAAGNVGIGTTSPDDKLEVEGGGIAINNPSDPYLRFRQSGTIVSDIFTDTSGNNLIVRGSSGVGVEILANGASEGAAHLVVSGSNGNVGIGTASPANKLEVSDTQTTIPQFQIKETSSAYHRFGILKSGSSVHFVEPGNDGLSAAEYLMTINMNGNNVGIGTTSPGYRLDIQSGSANFRYDQPSSTSYTYFRNWASGGSVALLLGTNDSDDSNAEIIFSNNTLYLQSYGDPGSSIQFGTRNSSTSAVRMKIDQDGNVGIGTTSPSSKLDVSVTPSAAWMHLINANETAFRLTTYNNGTNNGSSVYAFKHGLYYNSTENATVTFYRGDSSVGGFLTFTTDNGTERMRITNTGNVGIGTTTPNQKLSVEGGNIQLNANNAAANYYLYLNKKSGQDGGILFNRDNANDWQLTNGAGNGDLIFYSYGTSTEAITFKRATGNVGIGTTSPAYKLQVSGSIAIENQGTTTIESTTFAGSVSSNTNIAFVPTGSFKAAFFDYYVASGSVNMRAGTVMAVHNNSTSRYTDTSTADIGTTAAVDFSTSIVAGSLVLTANIASGTWEVKTAYRAL